MTAPRTTPFDAFLSYASADKAVADAACGVMEARGVRCWIAPRDITPGEDWSAGIMRGLGRCRVMVLVFSGKADKSPQVRREVERAVSKGLTVIPFRIENVTPTDGMEYFLSVPHWLDAYVPPLDDHLDRLADTVAALLASLPPPALPPGKGVRGLVRTAGRAMLARDTRARVLVFLFLAVLLSVGFYYAAGLMLKDPKANEDTIAAKAEAEQLAERVAALDRGQGFGEKIDAVGVTVRAAAAAFEQKKFADALDGHRAAGTQARDLLSHGDQRKAAEAARATADKARVDGAEAKATDQPGWAGAVELAELAAADFRAGDYVQASARWGKAAAGFRRAAGEKNLTAAKTKLAAELARVNVPHLEKLTPALWLPVHAKKAEAVAAENADPARAATKYDEAHALARAATLPMRRYAAFWLGVHCRFRHRYHQVSAYFETRLSDETRDFFEEELGRFDATAARALALPVSAYAPLDIPRGERTDGRLASLDRYIKEQLLDAVTERHEPDVGCSYRAGLGAASAKLAVVFLGRHPGLPTILGSPAAATAAAEMRGANWPELTVAPFNALRESLFALAPDAEESDEARKKRLEKGRARLLDLVEAAFDPLLASDAGIPKLVPTPRAASRVVSPLEVWVYRLRGGCRFDGDDSTRPVAVVDLNGRGLKDSSYAEVGAVADVRALRIDRTDTTAAGLKHLAEWTALEELHARSTRLTDDDGPALVPFKKLRVLLVGGTKVGDKFAAALADLKELRELDLSQTAVTDDALTHLAKLPNLVGVNLRGTKVTADAVAKFKKGSPKLEVVW